MKSLLFVHVMRDLTRNTKIMIKYNMQNIKIADNPFEGHFKLEPYMKRDKQFNFNIKNLLLRKGDKIKDELSEDMKILRVLSHNLVLSSIRTNQVPEIYENKEISINYFMNGMW